MESQSIPGPRCRRRYPSDFKSRLIAACREPGALIADIARAHQVDPRLLRRWLRKADLAIARGPALTGNTVPAVSAAPAFVPVTVTSLPMSLTDPISLEVSKRPTPPPSPGEITPRR